MPFTFRTIFSGLCAFVPDVEDNAEDQAGRWWVILPRLSRGRTVPPNDHPIAPHYPTLSFVGRNLLGGNAAPDLYVWGALDESRLGLRFFQGEIMRIGAGAAEDPALEVERNDPRARLDHLPKMAEIYEHAAQVRDENVFETGGEVAGFDVREDRISAAILLDKGLLKTHSLRRDAAGRELRFALDTTAAGPKAKGGRPLANEVALEIAGLEDKVELSFHKGSSVKTLLLGPDGERPDDDVEIRVMNWELETILGLGEGAMLQNGQDRDFLVFYDLARREDLAAEGASAPAPPEALLRVDQLKVPHFIGHGAGGPRQGCGGTEFNGHG